MARAVAGMASANIRALWLDWHGSQEGGIALGFALSPTRISQVAQKVALLAHDGSLSAASQMYLATE